MKQETKKRALTLATDIAVWLFILLALLCVLITLFSGRSGDGAVRVFGKEMRVVTSSSMEACPETDVSGFEIGAIPVKSMVFIETVPDGKTEEAAFYAGLKPGDVLTFRYVYLEPVVITHRVTSVTQKENGAYRIELSGDNKSAGSDTLTQTLETDRPETGCVIGKVTGQNRALGFIVYSLKQPLCMVFLVILPAALIAVMEVLRVVSILGAGKKEKDAEKDAEILELRRRLAALEEDKKQQNSDSEQPGGTQHD